MQFVERYASSCFYTILSRNLLMKGRLLITDGSRLFFLSIGEITACLRDAGKMPVCKEVFMIVSSVCMRQCETDLKSLVGMGSREQVLDLRR